MIRLFVAFNTHCNIFHVQKRWRGRDEKYLKRPVFLSCLRRGTKAFLWSENNDNRVVALSAQMCEVSCVCVCYVFELKIHLRKKFQYLYKCRYSFFRKVKREIGENQVNSKFILRGSSICTKMVQREKLMRDYTLQKKK